MAHRLAGDREAAAREFEKAVGAVAKAPAPQEVQALSAELAAEVEEFGDDGLLEKACRVYLDSARASGLSPTAQMLFGGMRKNPLSSYAKLCFRAKKHAELYHALKGLDIGMGFGVPVFYLLELQEEEQREFFKVAKEEALKDAADLAGLKWLAASVGSADRFGMGQGFGIDATELWEKARERAPKDLEVLQALAQRYAKKDDAARAVKACEEILAGVEAGAGGPKAWSRARALLAIAEQQQKANDEKAKGTLARIDPATLEMQPWELWKAGELFEKAGDRDRAAAAIARTELEGYRPYLRLAELHLKREDWTEAMRALNRAIAFGTDRDIPAPGSLTDIIQFAEEPDPEAAKRPDPEKMKAELYRKIGADYFIEKLAASKLPAMSSEEEKRARELLGRLSSEDVQERDDAFDAIRKMGPKCAPVLKEGLKSADDEARMRARQLLTEWSEPR
jgi:tetratricopeptide (TPR) repeat protein